VTTSARKPVSTASIRWKLAKSTPATTSTIWIDPAFHLFIQNAELHATCLDILLGQGKQSLRFRQSDCRSHRAGSERKPGGV
jgi:hypothetical protein